MAISRTHALGINPTETFSRSHPLGEFSLRRLDPARDAQQVQQWTSQPHARYWGMNQLSVVQVARFYAEFNAKPGCAAYLGCHQGEPCFLIERYDPAEEPVGGCYAVQAGDIGMHLLIALPSPDRPRLHGFSYAVMCTVMDFLFSRLEATRVVVEPDWRNDKIHALNRRVGFMHQRLVRIGEKTAYLAFCTRAQYHAARRWLPAESEAAYLTRRGAGVPPVDEAYWQRANQALIRKCLAEFSHERILQPQRVEGSAAADQDGWSLYELKAPQADVVYSFMARRLPLDHWDIVPDTLQRQAQGRPRLLDAARFIVEFADTLGIQPQNLPVYLEEVAATLAGRTRKLQGHGIPADELATANFQTIETAMIEGHPAFIANSGRIGFDALDMQRYAPEAGQPVRLIWLAAHCSVAEFSCVADLDYERLMSEELDLATRHRFEQTLGDRGLAPQDYLLMPVHPWQWTNKLGHLFAGELASQRLVYLGQSDDAYLAQQSVRTFFNISNPGKRYVKTALSVLNMGFTRGLSPYYMRTNPLINEWVDWLVREDAYLQAQGFRILREVAGIGYGHPLYGDERLGTTHLNKMLAVLWRESPVHHLEGGQRLMTMAALLHVDAHGQALLPALIRRSGLSVDAWLAQYLRAYLAPLLHCFYRYGLVFMPHGENVILVIEHDVPVRALMKDIGEEVCVLNGRTPVPAKIARIATPVPEDMESLSILTDVFDCFFRYLSALLFEQIGYEPASFWRRVADCIHDYERANPDLAPLFVRHDLFVEQFALSCLNRLQLKNNQQLINLADPFEALTFAGQLENPVASYRLPRSGS